MPLPNPNESPRVYSQPVIVQGAVVSPATMFTQLQRLTIMGLIARISWGLPEAEAGNVIEVQATALNLDTTPLIGGAVEVEVLVTDSTTSAVPSASATLAAATSPVGVVLAGSGTSLLTMRTSVDGLFRVAVLEVGVGSRYLWVRQGPNSTALVCAHAAPLPLTFA